MAISVQFYKFPKKVNSTARPTDTGTAATLVNTYNVELINDCSIIAPEIRILGAANNFNPRQINYCYIPFFDRYYWVSNWTYTNRMWVASCNVDPLASWKDSIGNSYQYINRASNADYWSIDLVDNIYPATSTVTKTEKNFPRIFSESRDKGTFVISTLGAANDMVNYYALTPEQYKIFVEALFGPSNLWQTIINNLTNPMDYILSLRWFPIPYDQFVGVTAGVIVGNTLILETTFNYQSKVIKTLSWSGQQSIVLDAHPGTAKRGPWVNIAPYTRREIIWPPIGQIPLDGLDIRADNDNKYRLTIKFDLDIPSGMATYTVLNQGIALTTGPCKLAADLPFAGQQVDIGGVLGGAVMSVTSGAAENFVGALSGAVNALTSAIPQVSSRGSTGSTLALTSPIACVSRFCSFPPDSPETFGRPSMRYVQCRDVPGYQQIETPVLSFAATDGELSAIENYMKGGYYYE